MDGRLQIFGGSANPSLATAIVGELELPLGRRFVGSWSDGESRIELEENVRGSDVFVIQPMCYPVNQNIIELLLMIDAVRRASASRVTAVIPYFAYSRQEKKTRGREPVSAKVIANLLVTTGVDRILTLDMHSPAIEGFFDIPVDHLRSTPILATHFRRSMMNDLVVVSPDAGGVGRAEDFRQRVSGSLAIISRKHPGPEQTQMLEMVGDVQDRDALIVDDVISTGDTLVNAAETLMSRGARSVRATAVHGVFAADALQRIDESIIEKVYVTDTIPLPVEGPRDKIEVLTVAPLLAEAIMRIHKDLSISALFV
ncbi:MAG TPA: ribose-phosphate pyrophosphokinase [Nitrolancea sp.]|jgi:ribose-phosphate pyrophosphokinase|nr:ribose-phosphate pyrophosphokinase [Nitrolancea sp.]